MPAYISRICGCNDAQSMGRPNNISSTGSGGGGGGTLTPLPLNSIIASMWATPKSSFGMTTRLFRRDEGVLGPLLPSEEPEKGPLLVVEYPDISSELEATEF